MITRVTGAAMADAAKRHLNANRAALAALQVKASSRQAIGTPSDDPAGTADSMRTRALLRANGQYTRNADNGNGWLTSIDSALTRTSELLTRARDLVVQGANDGALSPAAKEAVAIELESIRDDLLGVANTGYLGRSVFAGTSSAGVAFTSAYAFTGTAGSTVERRVGPDTTVRVDADGAAVFGTGADSVFALLDDVAADLRAGVNVSARLGAIDERMNQVIGAHAEVGRRELQIERAQDALSTEAISLEAQRQGIEEVDLPSIIIDLQVQQVNYQTALATTAKVLPRTLMDFLS